MSQLTITVIIPTYNRADLLRESLISVLTQTRKADQVIVVDDGSTDHTGKVVGDAFREFAPETEWPYVRYIHQKENKGKSVAVNAGIANATGDLVWIMDDDDVAHDNRIEQVAQEFEADPGLDVVHTGAYWEHEATGKTEQWHPRYVPDQWQLRAMLNGNFWFGISVMWRRSILTRLAELERRYYPYLIKWRTEFEPSLNWPFDPDLERAQDFDFWIRLAWAGAKVKAYDVPTVTAINRKMPRGIGQKIPFDQVNNRTALCETKIFRKLYERIPVEQIFHLDGAPANQGLEENAYAELAHALFRRSLLVECCACLEKITHPRRLSRLHRPIIRAMQAWVNQLGKDATVANVETLDGKAMPEEVQGVSVAETVADIQARVANIKAQIQRITLDWEIGASDVRSMSLLNAVFSRRN